MVSGLGCRVSGFRFRTYLGDLVHLEGERKRHHGDAVVDVPVSRFGVY